jgi:hypothetical protein
MTSRRRRVPRYRREDPSGQNPEIPCDAIPADLSQRAPNNSYSPPTFYRDYEFACVDCGKREVWTAEQQRWWYEVAKGSIYSGAKRCRACRAARSQAHRGTPRRSHGERTGERDA